MLPSTSQRLGRLTRSTVALLQNSYSTILPQTRPKSTGTPNNGCHDTDAKISKLKQQLEFAIEGARNSSASANLAFLERDPTERGPRVQFELDATVGVRDYIQSGVRDAKGFLETTPRSSWPYGYGKQLRSLQNTVELAEMTILDLNAKIIDAQEKMRRLEDVGGE